MRDDLVRVRKAFAYVTNGGRIVVFSHPDYPEAGIQVPAGTMRPDESPEDAVLREAFEETGLEDLRIERFLGEQEVERVSDEEIERFGGRELHHRFFFHLSYSGESPDVWQHYELHDGLRPPTLFDLFWAPIDAVPDLIAGHDRFLPELRASLAAS
jgi:8-oxo-dGTP pyrophosphatase MutT (NUDIX family)